MWNVTSLKLTANAPENRGPLEKEIPIGNHHFFGAMLVLGSVGSIETNKSHKQVYNEHFLPARFETFFGYMVSNHK